MDPNNATHAAHGPEGTKTVLSSHGAYAGDELDPEKGRESSLNGQNLKGADTQVLNASHQSVVDSPATQIIGVMILEFGVLLHRCVHARFSPLERLLNMSLCLRCVVSSSV